MLNNGAYDERFKELMQEAYQQDASEQGTADRYLLPGADRRMIANIFQSEPVQVSPEPKKIRLWPKIAVAASIAAVMGIGTLIYVNRHNKHNIETLAVNDVAPGKVGATLTLANGKKILLTDAVNGQLAREAGVKISKSKNGQLLYQVTGDGGEDKINTLTTANGETYQVRLPDGSQAWLNAASSLTYSASLIKNGNRSVKLTGEGYFEIAKDKLHPFVVETATQKVEVLGTHFNVNAYTDEAAVATSLLEGSVKVSSSSGAHMIKPGQQALNDGAGIKVVKTDVDKVVDWKDGEFNLDEVDFRTAMRKIARWYDIEVVYDKSVPENIEAWGWISRSSKLSSVLKLIENSGLVRFRIEGKKVYVFK
ncbi:anti-sigma factor [Pararcticibacter amylolyticus]|uniref:Anti-sigma factor n=2 Tax=Pararcticibacter amylolyticus TaxID=2173175 RepID=A0A2U2PHM8_9SPHI|nr:anti-sigma factor [Pararcticibacter amylolyticus]